MVAEWLWLSGLYVLVKWVNLSLSLKQEEVKSTANTMAERVAAYLIPIKWTGEREVELPKYSRLKMLLFKKKIRSFLKPLKNFKWDLLSVVIMCYVSLDLESSFWMVDDWVGVINYHISCFLIQKYHLGYLTGMGRSFMNDPDIKVQDKSQSLQNFSCSSNSCKWEALTRSQRHRIWYIPNKTNHYHTPTSSHLRFQRKILRFSQAKTWELGILHQQGGPGHFRPVASSWAAWLVGPNI